MLSGIAEGDTRLDNYSTGADCASTLGCMQALGVEWEREKGSIVIHGRGGQRPRRLWIVAIPDRPSEC